MCPTDWDVRFSDSTRGKLLDHLRRGVDTVHGLAARLGVAANTVRTHLATLERDGMVRPAGTVPRGTVGKPAIRYELVPEVESRFSRAYLPFLEALLAAVAERMPADQFRELLSVVGRRLAPKAIDPNADFDQRIGRAAELLTELGGVTTQVSDGDTVVLEGHGCPLGIAVAEHPTVCQAVREMLAIYTGLDVREACQHGARPQCRLVLRAPSD